MISAGQESIIFNAFSLGMGVEVAERKKSEYYKI
jgi:hypothetical protein